MSKYNRQFISIWLKKKIPFHITGSSEVCGGIQKELSFPVTLLGQLFHQAGNKMAAKLPGPIWGEEE